MLEKDNPFIKSFLQISLNFKILTNNLYLRNMYRGVQIQIKDNRKSEENFSEKDKDLLQLLDRELFIIRIIARGDNDDKPLTTSIIYFYNIKL